MEIFPIYYFKYIIILQEHLISDVIMKKNLPNLIIMIFVLGAGICFYAEYK